MSSTAPTPSDLLSILPQFLTTLQSSSPISIPPPTLLGAITHFLSQLDPPHLNEFISTLVSSPSLWSQGGLSTREIRNAIRLSVPARIAKINQETTDVYFKNSRRRRRAIEWLDTWLRALPEEQASAGAGQVQIALLQGLDDVQDMDWGNGRVKLEETVVLSLAEMPEDTTTLHMQGLVGVIPHIALDRLQALDMNTLSAHIERYLYVEMDRFNGSTGEDIPSLSRALARSFEVLHSGGPSSRKCAREKIIRFCVDIGQRAEKLESEWTKHSTISHDNDADPVWLKNKTTFFSFLTVGSTILDILLSHPDTSESYHDLHPPSPVNIAIHLLNTLGSFAYLTDASQGGFENYHKVLYGSLDIISTQGGSEGVTGLFKGVMENERLSHAKVGYVLVLAEELIHLLEKREIDVLLPLAERHVYRPAHKSSFEASHAFLLALLKSSAENLDGNSSQAAFFDALLPNYLNIITKQYTQKLISSDQFRQAFPNIVESSLKRSPSSTQLCLSYLFALPLNSDIRQIRITVAPYIDSAALPAYLEDLAQMILTTERHSEERMDLSKNAFELVVKDLSDENKQVGIDCRL
ncbi:hypothetical protein I302_108769 [Kwoniella bestiolae CBS 10118]|uniref:Uncharacterized protein n=1 Tax=Kwoniella bestiolae CBS 10118 TaxID=1296100 RepID=A0AAJ8MDB0_9TREE